MRLGERLLRHLEDIAYILRFLGVWTHCIWRSDTLQLEEWLLLLRAPEQVAEPLYIGRPEPVMIHCLLKCLQTIPLSLDPHRPLLLGLHNYFGKDREQRWHWYTIPSGHTEKNAVYSRHTNHLASERLRAIGNQCGLYVTSRSSPAWIEALLTQGHILERRLWRIKNSSSLVFLSAAM